MYIKRFRRSVAIETGVESVSEATNGLRGQATNVQVKQRSKINFQISPDMSGFVTCWWKGTRIIWKRTQYFRFLKILLKS